MLHSLKRYLDRFPMLAGWRRTLSLRKFEVKDIYDAFVARSLPMRRTPLGFKFAGSHSPHHAAMQRGEFEPEETALFSDLFRNSDVFVDVGANVGFYSCLARSMDCHVLAVEPMQRNLGHLYRNLLANGWLDVEVFPLGVSERPGIAQLYGASSTGASLIENWAGASRLFHQTIALSTLDTLVANRFEGRQVFIKIDVEGAEYAVLRGALETIRMQPSPTWVIEVCLNEYHPEGMNPHFADTFQMFWDHGYEARTADARNRLVTPGEVAAWVRAGLCDSGTINYRFCPPSTAQLRGPKSDH